MELDKKYIIYGIGSEAQQFLFKYIDIIPQIEFCINDLDGDSDEFHKLEVHQLNEVNLNRGEGRQILVAASDEKMYYEMRQNLTGLGLVEFEDFIWSKAFRKKIAVVNANCHGPAVIKYLRLSSDFNKTYMVYPVPEIQLNNEIPSNLLKNTDLYIHQDIRENNSISYKLSDAYICPQLKENAIDICIPNLVGMGKWMFPSLGGLDKLMPTHMGAMNVMFRDYVLDEAVNQCGSFEEYRDFWKNYTYDNTEHENRFNNFMNKLCEREKNWDIKISKFIKENYRHIPCFVDAGHPSKYVMKEIGRQVAGILGLDDIDDSDYKSGLGICVPIMHDVSSYFQLDSEVPLEINNTIFWGKREERRKEEDDYIRAYLWWYHDIFFAING